MFPHDDLRLFQPAALMRDTVLIESDRPHPASLHLHHLPTHKACQCLPSMFVCSIPRCIPHPIGTITWVLIPTHPNWHRFPHDANGVKRNISNLNQRLLKKVTDRGKCILLRKPLALCYIHNDDDSDESLILRSFQRIRNHLAQSFLPCTPLALDFTFSSFSSVKERTYSLARKRRLFL